MYIAQQNITIYSLCSIYYSPLPLKGSRAAFKCLFSVNFFSIFFVDNMGKSFRNNRKVINVLKLYEQILSVTVPKNASFVPYTSLFCPSWPVYPGLPGLPASCQDLTDRVTQVLSPALCISLIIMQLCGLPDPSCHWSLIVPSPRLLHPSTCLLHLFCLISVP